MINSLPLRLGLVYATEMDGTVIGAAAPARPTVALAVRSALMDAPPFVLRRHLLPFGLTAAVVAGALAWNARVGLVLSPAPALFLLAAAGLMGIGGLYAALRIAPPVTEMAFYGALWISFPAFAVLTSYLGVSLRLPLWDGTLTADDAALGFHWWAWSQFVQRHTLFRIVQWFAYESFNWQPVAAVAIFALVRPGSRNRDFLTAVLVALILTLALAARFPAIGPADAFGIEAPWAPSFHALRAGTPGVLPYVGMVSFPSFHTVMAILFTWAHRGIRRTFPVAVALNALMLVAIPLNGGHYLSDMIGGAVVAAAAILVARRLCPPAATCAPGARTA